GIGAVAVATLHNSVEHCQRTFTDRIEPAARPDVAFKNLDQSCMAFDRTALAPLLVIEPLRQHPMMHRGTGPQIQRRQMKAEGVDAPEQPAHGEVAGM